MQRLLVLDDEERFRAVLRRILERSGYAVEEASRESLEKSTGVRIDLVIVHLQAPEPAGEEAIALVRELIGDVPIIVLSSFRNALEEALAMGADVTLKKPFDPDDLLAAVRMLLAGRE
jgi:DNA-binding response OmpR family regulator